MKKLATGLVISSIIIATNAFASPNHSGSSNALGQLAAASSYYSKNQDGDNDQGRGYFDNDRDHNHGRGRGPDCDRGESWHSRNCRPPVSP